MQLNLRIAIWNANGLLNHLDEVELFLKSNFIDILLISESHLTSKSYLKLKGYDIITANQPDDRAHAGAAIILKSQIIYDTIEPIRTKTLQAACVKIKSNNQSISICAIYFPPCFSSKLIDYKMFLQLLGPNFIVGGDFNAKHTWWISRLINPKGRELYKCIQENNYSVLSTGNPTYWPTDKQKIPDLLDFIVYKGICNHSLSIKEINELSSDHSPLLLNFNQYTQVIFSKTTLLKHNTDLTEFQRILNSNINLNTPLKSPGNLDAAVDTFTNIIRDAALTSTPNDQQNRIKLNSFKISYDIKILLKVKRKLRKTWKLTRNPVDKTNLNKATQRLKEMIREEKSKICREYLESLDVTNNSEHNLWRATKYLKRPTKRNINFKDNQNNWCRSDQDKANAFADDLENRFCSFDFAPSSHIKYLDNFLENAGQMCLPIKWISPHETRTEIMQLNNTKAPGHDFINSKLCKNLTDKAVLFLTYLFNAIIRLNYFPQQRKSAEIIMIPKPGKSETIINSYRPISLLVTF